MTKEQETNGFPISDKCGFAYPGTWGHECGRKATQVFVFKSDNTRDGLYFATRCDECAKITNGENVGLIRKEAIAGQCNKFR